MKTVSYTHLDVYKRQVLAQSATAYTVCASPRQVADAQAFAQLLSPILDMEASEIERRVSDTSKGGVTIKRQVSREVAQQLKTRQAEHEARDSDALDGLYLEEESKRYYPMGAFASQLIGLTTDVYKRQAPCRAVGGRRGRRPDGSA